MTSTTKPKNLQADGAELQEARTLIGIPGDNSVSISWQLLRLAFSLSLSSR